MDISGMSFYRTRYFWEETPSWREVPTYEPYNVKDGMDYILLLCLKTLLAHENMVRHNDIYTEGTSIILDTQVRDNIYAYTISLSGQKYLCKYIFNSNTFVFGALDVIDIRTNITTTYSVTRAGDTIRIYSDPKNYTEFHICNKLTVITIRVVSNKKQQIGCFNLGQCSPVKYTMIGNTVYAKAPKVLDTHIILPLFAVTGAIDYDAIICPDLVCFRSARMLMTIHTDTHTQLIVSNTFPMDSIPEGNVSAINSDFKQRYTYVAVGDDTYSVIEYVPTHRDEETIKRNYVVVVDDGRVLVPDKGLVFTTTYANNAVRFQRI